MPVSEPMDITYSISWRDYLEAQRRYTWEMPWSMVWVPGLFLGLAIVLIVLLGWSLLSQTQDRHSVILGWILLLGSALFTGFMLFWPWLTRREFFSEDRWMHLDQTARIDENGILFTCALSTTQYPWVAFLRVIETQNLFVLPIKLQSFHWIPKNAFSPDQMAQFRELLKRRLPAK